MTAGEVQRQNERVTESRVGDKGRSEAGQRTERAMEQRLMEFMSTLAGGRGGRRGGGSHDRQETGGGGRMRTEGLSSGRALPP